MNNIHHEQSDSPVSQDQAYSPYQEKILDDNPIAGLELYRSTIQPSEHSHRQQPGLLSPSDESSHTSDNLTTKDSTPQVPPSRHSRGPRFWLIASLGVFAIMATVAAIVTGVLLAKSRSTHNQRYYRGHHPVDVKLSINLSNPGTHHFTPRLPPTALPAPTTHTHPPVFKHPNPPVPPSPKITQSPPIPPLPSMPALTSPFAAVMTTSYP